MSLVSAGLSSTDLAAPNCNRCVRLIIWIGIIEALVFMVLKVVLGMACGSRALVAASLYSMQDLIASVVAAIGLKISARPADQNHPYGHGKIEYLVVVLMSVMILLGVVALAITSLASFMDTPAVAEAPSMLALWVAAVCGVSCYILGRYQECAGIRLNSPALKSCATHMHGDCVASIAVVISVIGAKLGYTALDHMVAIVEAVHVVYISGRMLGSAVGGLMDGAVQTQLIEDLQRTVGAVDSVTHVRQTTARWVGQMLIAQVEVEVPGDMNVPAADRLRAGIEQAVQVHVCAQSQTLVRIAPSAAR